MKKSAYLETSIPSYLTAKPSRDIRAAACQQITAQWWDEARVGFNLFTSELVIVEASAGNPDAAARRLEVLQGIARLAIDEEAQTLAGQLLAGGGLPASAEADALHIAVAAVHRMDFLLTWNCRHIDNATRKPIIRPIFAMPPYPVRARSDIRRFGQPRGQGTRLPRAQSAYKGVAGGNLRVDVGATVE